MWINIKAFKTSEIFIKHKIQSASAFYHSVSYPSFIAYVAKDALIGPQKRAIFLIELNPSDKENAVYAFNQIFGASELKIEDDSDSDGYNESTFSNSISSFMSLEDIFQPYEIDIAVYQTYF